MSSQSKEIVADSRIIKALDAASRYFATTFLGRYLLLAIFPLFSFMMALESMELIAGTIAAKSAEPVWFGGLLNRYVESSWLEVIGRATYFIILLPSYSWVLKSLIRNYSNRP